MELREWQYMNPPQVAGASGQVTSGSSSGYKKRFEKLIKYHIDHASSELESITRKDIGNGYFRLSEHWYHAARPDGYDRDITVHYNQSTDTFSISIYIDHNEVEDTKEIGYENFLKFLKNYMWLPKIGSAEYNDLLTEALTEWVAMKSNNNSSQPAANTQSQEDRYKSLLAQIDADGLSTYVVNDLTEDTLDISLTTKKKIDLDIKIVYNSTTNDYSFQVGRNKPLLGCDYEKDILELFLIADAIKNTNLCESAGSIADDFKLYENLWDDDEGKRFKVIMIVDDEEYTYGTYDSRNRANEVAMKVRDEREVDTYIEEV